MSDFPAELTHQVYEACRDGKTLMLVALLLNRSPGEMRTLLGHLTEEAGQSTTPLLIAARNGHSKVVKTLLDQYHVDPEQTGSVKFADGYTSVTSAGATALWCAAGEGHLEVVKVLIEKGANINHPTNSNSTPLRAACFLGRVDLVTFLLDHGADLHICNVYKNTCLMIATYKGHFNVVRLLIQRGARVNDRAACKASAIHFAAEMGHLKVVRLLIENGAVLFENDLGMTPLHLAAEHSHCELVEYFISLSRVSKEERIEALELLGSSYANDKDHYNISKCYQYLHRAMRERFEDAAHPILKDILPPVKAYGNMSECQTLEELEDIKQSHYALQMQALLCRERILTEDNPEIPRPIVYRGAVFADSGQFERCISLWMRSLFLRYKNSRSISKELLRFAQVFCQMLNLGVTLEYDLVEHVLEHCLLEFEKDDQRLNESANGSQVKDANIRTALYLFVILIKIGKSSEESERLCQFSYEFNRRRLRCNPSGSNLTPLHMACDQSTHVDDFHVDEIVHFPNDSLVKLLISCGADVNAVDSKGNTPLHLIVQYNRPLSDFITLHSIIVSLIEGGTHIDRTNKLRKTALDLVTTGVAEVILRTEQRIELKCLAARAIRDYAIEYEGQVPVMLEDFIQMH